MISPSFIFSIAALSLACCLCLHTQHSTLNISSPLLVSTLYLSPTSPTTENQSRPTTDTSLLLRSTNLLCHEFSRLHLQSSPTLSNYVARHTSRRRIIRYRFASALICLSLQIRASF